MPATIAIRPFRPTDRAFVLDSMRRTLVRNSAYAAGLQPEVVNLLVEPILATYQTLVATPDGQPDEILGYVIHDGPSVVGFIYVKEALREKGIASALIKAAGIDAPKKSKCGAVGDLCKSCGDMRNWDGCGKTLFQSAEIVAPLLVTKLPGAGNFPKLCESKGYTVRFRPWMGLSMLADLMTQRAA